MFDWFEWAMMLAVGWLALCVVVAAIRVFVGPHPADRAVALDMATYVVICVVGLSTLLTGETALLDVALILSLVSFLGTVAFARFIERSVEKSAS